MIGSLCSGIDGLALGLETVGLGPVAWHAETDPAASFVLARHWPGVPNHGDIKETDWSSVEPVDLVIGGPPCQPISSSGRRGGTADERWLWPDAIRAVGLLRPRVAFFENPLGLLNGRQDDGDTDSDMDGEALGEPATDPSWFGAVLGALAEVGYDAIWTCVRASAVGAPHRRERVFVLATPDADGRRQQVGQELDSEPQQRPSNGRPRRRHAHGLGRPVAANTAGSRRGAHAGGGPGPLPGAEVDGWPAGEPRRHDRGDRGRPVEWGPYAPAIARWEAHHGPAPSPLDGRGRLNPAFSEWMIGLPPGWVTDHLGRTAALRCIGNAVVPAVAALAWTVLHDRITERAA